MMLALDLPDNQTHHEIFTLVLSEGISKNFENLESWCEKEKVFCTCFEYY